MPINKVTGKGDGKQKYRVRVNYQDSSGNYKQVERACYGLDEAKELERSMLAEAVAVQEGKTLTLRMLCAEYEKSRKNEVKETTTAKSERVMELHVLPTLGDIRINKLTIPVLQKWKNGLNETEFVFRTKANIFSVFRAVLNYAVKMEYIASNPLLKVGNFKDIHFEKASFDFYTGDEFIKFIAAAEEAAKESEQKGSGNEWNYYVFFALRFIPAYAKVRYTPCDGQTMTASFSRLVVISRKR